MTRISFLEQIEIDQLNQLISLKQLKKNLKSKLTQVEKCREDLYNFQSNLCSFPLQNDEKCNAAKCNVHTGWKQIKIAQADLLIFEYIRKYRSVRSSEVKIKDSIIKRRESFDNLLQKKKELFFNADTDIDIELNGNQNQDLTIISVDEVEIDNAIETTEMMSNHSTPAGNEQNEKLFVAEKLISVNDVITKIEQRLNDGTSQYITANTPNTQDAAKEISLLPFPALISESTSHSFSQINSIDITSEENFSSSLMKDESEIKINLQDQGKFIDKTSESTVEALAPPEISGNIGLKKIFYKQIYNSFY
ncbi:hypothetical protein HDU92_007048 [Lobulomyces angularis]|nr:hypothetical protein HDU92_007048 [Lobulomyces angularis]